MNERVLKNTWFTDECLRMRRKNTEIEESASWERLSESERESSWSKSSSHDFLQLQLYSIVNSINHSTLVLVEVCMYGKKACEHVKIPNSKFQSSTFSQPQLIYKPKGIPLNVGVVHNIFLHCIGPKMPNAEKTSILYTPNSIHNIYILAVILSSSTFYNSRF